MENKKRRKRVDITLRLQGYEGDATIEVFEYLKSLPEDEMRQRVNSLLMAAFLPYARYHKGYYEQSHLRYACWESQDCLNKHGACMRLALGVEQPQFLQPNNQYLPYFSSQPSVVNNDGIIQSNIDKENTPEEEQKAPEPLIEGDGSVSDVDDIFAD